MVKTRLISVRLSKRQYELLTSKMECMGYVNKSQFIRDSTLRDDFVTLKLLRDIHEKIVGTPGNGSSGDSSA